VQFLPAIVLPQFLLCGLFAPRDSMQTALRWVSDVLPLSYAVDAMDKITTSPDVSRTLVVDMAIIAGAGVLALALGAATLRRRTE
jgi:ABC-2 type transport system permease protein